MNLKFLFFFYVSFLFPQRIHKPESKVFTNYQPITKCSIKKYFEDNTTFHMHLNKSPPYLREFFRG